MAFKRVAILSIGEMGYHWARLLTEHGVEVLTASEGRTLCARPCNFCVVGPMRLALP